jgi:hypothetical protein
MADQYQPGGDFQEQAFAAKVGTHGSDRDGRQRSGIGNRGWRGQNWRRMEPHVREPTSLLATRSTHISVHTSASWRCALAFPEYEPSWVSTSVAEPRRLVSLHGHTTCRRRRDTRHTVPGPNLRRFIPLALFNTSRPVQFRLPPSYLLPSCASTVQMDRQRPPSSPPQIPTSRRNLLHPLRALARAISLFPRSQPKPQAHSTPRPSLPSLS